MDSAKNTAAHVLADFVPAVKSLTIDDVDQQPAPDTSDTPPTTFREPRKLVEIFINNRRALGYDDTAPRIPVTVDQSASALLRLPLEIRLKILEYAIAYGARFPPSPVTVTKRLKWNLKTHAADIEGAATSYMTPAQSGSPSPRTALRLAQTCAQLYFDVVDAALFYRTSTLRFPSPVAFLEWAETVSHETLGRLHAVHIAAPNGPHPWRDEVRYAAAFTFLAHRCPNLRALALRIPVPDPREGTKRWEPIRAEHLRQLGALRGLRSFHLDVVPEKKDGGWTGAAPYSTWTPDASWEQILAGSEEDLDEVVVRYGMSPREYAVLGDELARAVSRPKESAEAW